MRELVLPLRTSRLILRDFQPDDFEAVHAYASDPEVTRYMFYGPRTIEETRDYLDRMLASQRQEPRMVWELAVVRAADGVLLGACDLTLEREDEADLGYIFAREAWGLGYATEAARAMVSAAFQQLVVRRVFATCDIGNHASARVLQKAGLQRRAVLEQHKFARNRWWTSLLYDVDRDEWTTLQSRD